MLPARQLIQELNQKNKNNMIGINNKIGARIAVSLFIIGFLCMLYYGFQFRHHFAFTTGIVTDITPPGYKGSGDYSIVFEYMVNSERYHGNNDREFCRGQDKAQLKALLLGKRFPVVYGTKSPSIGYMLLSQDYADKFKYTLPDSVRYYDSVLNCK
jgi:hypothetical protein